MKLFWKNSLNQKRMYVIAEGLILAYICECVLGSSGHLITIGRLSIRMILFSLCFIVTLPPLVSKLKSMAQNQLILSQILAVGCFGIWLLIGAMIGLKVGNNSSLIRADISTYLALALFPGFLSVMSTKKTMQHAINVVFYSAVLLAVITAAIHIFTAFCSSEAINCMNQFLNEKSLGGLAILNTGIWRIYMKSQIFIQVALIYGVWLMMTLHSRWKKICLMICEGILAFTLLLTYTRAFWVGLFGSAVILLILEAKQWKRLLVIAFTIVCMVISFLGISGICYQAPFVVIELVNRFSPNLLPSYQNNNSDLPSSLPEITPSVTDVNHADVVPLPSDLPEVTSSMTDIVNMDAVALRSETLKMLKSMIKENPILGNGLGTNLNGIRQEGKVEYMYLDVLLKLGFIGLFLFMAAYFMAPIYGLYRWINDKEYSQKTAQSNELMQRHVFIASYLGVAITSFFNPFLNNPMGITLLMITSAGIFCNYNVENKEIS